MLSAPALQPSKRSGGTHILTALLDLFRLGGYGTAIYEFGAADFAHTQTIATVQPSDAEAADVTLFLGRLRREHDWRQGDQLHLEYQKGRLKYARLVRVPRD